MNASGNGKMKTHDGGWAGAGAGLGRGRGSATVSRFGSRRKRIKCRKEEKKKKVCNFPSHSCCVFFPHFAAHRDKRSWKRRVRETERGKRGVRQRERQRTWSSTLFRENFCANISVKLKNTYYILMSKMAAVLALDAADAGVAAAPLLRRNVCYTFFVAVVTFNARIRLAQHGERDN